MHEYIYVINDNGHPLMPTKRKRHIQHLLKTGRAVVIALVPFTVKLKYHSTENIQNLYGGTDPGRTNIGMAVITENGEVVYKAYVETRNKEIPKLMKERRLHRQTSRRGERLARKRLAKKLGTTSKKLLKNQMKRKLPGCEEPLCVKDIINTEARFNNRKRPKGWLTPTARQLVQTHTNMIRKICKILPVTHWTLEINRFSFMELENGKIYGSAYSNGRMKGYKDVYEYVYDLQNGQCGLCARPIHEYHHMVPRHKYGSDRPENIIGLCEKCHEKVHTGSFKLEDLGEKKKYAGTSMLNICIPYIQYELEKMFKEHFHTCFGNQTKEYRESHNVGKDHPEDAVCIAAIGGEIKDVYDESEAYSIKQYRRHNRQKIHAQRERTYKLDGKTIAKNRKPRFEQPETCKALSEAGLSRQEVSRLKVTKSKRYYREESKYQPGTEFTYKRQRYIMSGRSNNGYYFRAVGCGEKNFPTGKINITAYNKGLVYLA